MTTPLIAISASTRADDGVTRLRLGVNYIRAIERSGGLPLVVPPVADPATLATLLDRVDGLLLTGGEDVAPERYGASAHPRLGTVHPERDATELELVAGARERGLPTLAICRGIQVLGVALGGTLIQDIGSERTGALDHDPPLARDSLVHAVAIDPGSRLAAILGTLTLDVNSVHHQAVDAVPAGIRTTALAPDGIIEGIEWPGDDWWAIGVQWHPEELIDSRRNADRALFDELVAKAGGK